MQDDEIKIFTHEDLFGVDRVEFVTQDRHNEEIEIIKLKKGGENGKRTKSDTK
jgi:hypothetical protein